MADFSALKTSIQNYIKQNGNEEITGNLLQQVLLSMVTTLGDSAINDLVTALNNEVSARQNADGTLQGNINTLQGNINTLQGVVNGIKANIDNGYVYAGIANPSTTPASGKVFYLALTAGTYTNFGATVVPQGINILKYNGSAWSLDSFLGLDNAPTQGSNNLVKSGGIFPIYNGVQRSLTPIIGKVSIIGDSISTYNGTMPPGYPNGYPILDVTSVNEMWWKIILSLTDSSLEINASWSASRATNGRSGDGFPDFYDRAAILGEPDYIFVELGTNDSTAGVALGEYDYESSIGDLSESEFIPAYIKGVKALVSNYPTAKIILFIFQMEEGYAQAIRNIGLHYGLPVIDVRSYYKNNVHPDKQGMMMVAQNITSYFFKGKVDNEPTILSNNTALSGGTYMQIETVRLGINEVSGRSKKNVDISQLKARNGIIANNKWAASDTNRYQHILIPVVQGDKYTIENNKQQAGTFAFLSDYITPIIGATPIFCDGTQQINVDAGESQDITIPEGCKYLYVSTLVNSVDRLLDVYLSAITGELAGKLDKSTFNDYKTNLTGYDSQVIDISGVERHNGIISNGSWAAVTGGNYKHIVIPVIPKQVYTLTGNSTGSSSYACLKTYTIPASTSDTIDFCNGYSNALNVSTQTSVQVKIPADCNYLYITTLAGGADRAPMVVLDGNVGIVGDIEETVDRYINKFYVDFYDYIHIVGLLAGSTWNNSNKYSFVLIPVDKYRGFVTTISNPSGNGKTGVAFLRDNVVAYGQEAHLCSNTSEIVVLAGDTYNATIPADANYMYVLTKNNNNNSTPNVVIASNDNLVDRVDFLQYDTSKDEMTLRQSSNVIEGFGISNFIDKAMPVKVPVERDGESTYNAWPFITTFKDKIICLHTRANGHVGTEKRNVFMQYSFDGIVWSDERKVIADLNAYGGVTAIGNDPNGNIIIWVRNGGIATDVKHEVYRSTDGYNFTKISEVLSPFNYALEGMTSLINVPNVGLMSFFCTYKLGDGNNAWGKAVSNDNGLTWTLTEIATELDDFECPMEANGVYIDDGKILVMARRDVWGTPYVLHHIQSEDYGATWTFDNSNVSDIHFSTPSLIYDSDRGKIYLFYVKRDTNDNMLKERQADVDVVWDNPTSWPNSRNIHTFVTSDGGQANAVRFKDKNYCTEYAGSNTEDSIYVTMCNP